MTTEGAIACRSMLSRAGGVTCSGRIASLPPGHPVGTGTGAAAWIAAVAFDAEVADPAAFLAVTRTLSRRPWSAVASRYACPVAPPIAGQSDPFGLPPEVGQRTHWKLKLVGLFVHWPCVATSVEPTRKVPAIRGSATRAGTEDSAATSAVGFEALVAEPLELVAVTRTRILLPWSAVVSVYACPVAPPIAGQSDPFGLPPEVGQRTHWKLKLVGLFVHWPCVATSVEPTRKVPAIRGSATRAGTEDSAATSAVGFEALVAEPLELVAVTRTRILLPWSAVVSVYACPVAPPIAGQSDPFGLPPEVGQRTHWKLKLVGLFVHWPCVAVRVEPTRAVPVIVGSLTWAGA